ncbi:hypothetical protein ACI7BZ_01345 [Xanthobacter sp. AM11]
MSETFTAMVIEDAGGKPKAALRPLSLAGRLQGRVVIDVAS